MSLRERDGPAASIFAEEDPVARNDMLREYLEVGPALSASLSCSPVSTLHNCR